MRTVAKKIIGSAVYAIAVIGIALAVWAGAAAAVDSEFVLPSVQTTAREFVKIFGIADFRSGLGGTLLRSSVGFFISLGLFFATFFTSTAFPVFKRIIEPIISALRSLPAVAVTLILSLAVGGYGTPVVLGVLVIYPIMYSAAQARTATVSAELKEICVLLGANKRQTFKALWFPNLAGGLPDSLSSAFSYNIKAVIGAEILAQTAESLGMLMSQAQAYLEPARLIALVIAAVIVSVSAEIALRFALKLALRRYAD